MSLSSPPSEPISRPPTPFLPETENGREEFLVQRLAQMKIEEAEINKELSTLIGRKENQDHNVDVVDSITIPPAVVPSLPAGLPDMQSLLAGFGNFFSAMKQGGGGVAEKGTASPNDIMKTAMAMLAQMGGMPQNGTENEEDEEEEEEGEGEEGEGEDGEGEDSNEDEENEDE